MPELTKLWKEYESLKNGEGTSLGQGPTIEIRIPAKLVTTSNHQACYFSQAYVRSIVNKFMLFNMIVQLTYNSWHPWCLFFEQVRGSQLWGTDVYTDDSDLVAGMSWILLENHVSYFSSICMYVQSTLMLY